MRYLFNVIYLVILAVFAVLTIPFRRLRPELLHLIAHRFWGSSVPALDGRPVVWVHAVSVGEALTCGPLLDRLREFRPDLQFVMSVGTSDAMTVALRELPDTAIFYAPLDFTWSVHRVFDVIRPKALVIAENDFWPNMLNEAQRRNVALAIFNSRMSTREQKEHRWNGGILRPGLKRAGWWGAVTEQDAEWIRHFFRVEPPQLEVTGSIKFDGIVRSRDNPQTIRLREQFGLIPHNLVLIAGSTHPSEEEMLVEVAQRLSFDFPQLRLVLAPRNLSRCHVISKMLRRRGFHFVRASELTGCSVTSAFVTLIDSIGLLRTAWGFADFAFIGGSLVRHGGQNIVEPASYGVPVCFGEHLWNFRSVADEFLAAGSAVQIGSSDELERVIRHWISHPHEAEQIGRRAQELVKSQTRAIERSVRGILSILSQEDCNAATRCVPLNNDASSLQVAEAP